mgnify:CR=1 FL=1
MQKVAETRKELSKQTFWSLEGNLIGDKNDQCYPW